MGGRVIIKKNWNVDKEMENMDKEIKQRLDQQFDFIREIDKEKFIGRQTYLTGATRKDAGDTYAYDEEGKKTQAERERKAADRIYGMLPEEQGKKLYDLWLEFEAQETTEAKFARTMDNIQPMMLNAATDGKAWVEHGVYLDQILGRNAHTAEGSETLWEYAKENFIQPHIEAGHIREGKSEDSVHEPGV